MLFLYVYSFLVSCLGNYVYQARKKLRKMVILVDTILIADGQIQLHFPIKIQSGQKRLESLVKQGLDQMRNVVNWSGINMGSVDIYELKNMFAQNDNR